jgi:uncharacterized protein YecE (DUF72 family)
VWTRRHAAMTTQRERSATSANDPQRRGRIRLGTQGWNYEAWLGVFYPTVTRPADFLSVYSRAFSTVEVDSTFYAIPPATTISGWVARTPPGFLFSLKLPQVITHEKRLRDAHDDTALFLERARGLGEKLGPILIQLGPDFGIAELPALAAYLPTLPTDVSFAIEFRRGEWITREVHALLAEHGVALALSDGRWIPRETLLRLADHPTAPFHYIRWMGPDRSISDFSRIQIDRSREVEKWAEVLARIARAGPDAYGYVNNHFAGHSPETARELQHALGQPVVDPATLGEQISLF